MGLTPKPETREIAVVTVRDRFSSYPSQGLTPQRLASIFKEADAGDILRQMELFEEMEEKDTHLYSVLQTRKNAVLGLDWEVMPYSDDPNDVKVAAAVSGALAGCSLDDVVLDILDAIGKGFSVTEIMWDIRKGQAVPVELLWKPQRKFTFDELGRLRVLTEDAPALGIELPPNKFLVHNYRAKSGHPSRAGVIRVCAWMYLFKNYGLKDWISFAEIYGMPLRLGKYEPSTSEDDKQALIQAVQALGTDAAGVISKNTEIQFIEAVRTSSASLYDQLVKFCNAEISKAVLGQTLTTEVGDKGSYAASKTHNLVRQDLLESDCKALATTIRRQLIQPIVLFNFGPEAAGRLPWVKYHYEQPEDLKAAADTYNVLIQSGLPVATEHLYERFGIPKPEPNQQIVVPAAQSPGLALPMRMPFRAPGRTMLALNADGSPGTGNPWPAMDLLADRCLDEAGPLYRQYITTVKQALQKARSLEEVPAILADILRDLDTSQMEDLIARAQFVADLTGRWSARANT